MKLWIDDVRPAPIGYIRVMTVLDAKFYIDLGIHDNKIDGYNEISFDHDAGDCFKYGGDYIEILNWLEERCNIDGLDVSKVVFKFHSANPVGVMNMKRICEKNGWRYE